MCEVVYWFVLNTFQINSNMYMRYISCGDFMSDISSVFWICACHTEHDKKKQKKKNEHNDDKTC